MNSTNQLKTIDLNKYVGHDKAFRTTNQQDTIESILRHQLYRNKEYEINEIPRIDIRDLEILGYKKPEKAIKSLLDKGVVKQIDKNTIELITDFVYCDECRNSQVFVWDKIDHLRIFHRWDEILFKHNVAELKFSKKPIPDKIDHDYEQISQLNNNEIDVRCKNCGYERTIYIDYRDCDPYYKNLYIENPDSDKDIKIKFKHKEIVFKNQEELQKFIQSKLNGA